MDIRIGYDRTEPCFPGKGGTRLTCPFCEWYLDHTPIWDSVQYEPRYMFDLNSVSIPNFRATFLRIDLIAEEHLRDAHLDEPEVQRAIEIVDRQRVAPAQGGDVLDDLWLKP